MVRVLDGYSRYDPKFANHSSETTSAASRCLTVCKRKLFDNSDQTAPATSNVCREYGEPNSGVWFALGLIYEQYGAKEAAIVAYRRVNELEFDERA